MTLMPHESLVYELPSGVLVLDLLIGNHVL